MFDINNFKLDKSISAIIAAVKNPDGSWFGCMQMPRNKWKKMYTKLYEGLCKNNKSYIIYVFEMDEKIQKDIGKLNIKNVLFQDSIKFQ